MVDLVRCVAVLSLTVVALMIAGCTPTEESAVAVEIETPGELVAEEESVEFDGSFDAAALVGAWKLESLNGEPAAEDFATTLEFTEDGRLGGNAGCNNYGGDFSVEDGALVLPIAFAATKKMCPPPMMDQENAYLASLAGFERAAVDGDTLSLFVADEDEPMVFSRIVLDIAER